MKLLAAEFEWMQKTLGPDACPGDGMDISKAHDFFNLAHQQRVCRYGIDTSPFERTNKGMKGADRAT